MKKAIVLSILGIAASGLSAFGQLGAIVFNNYSAQSYEPVYYNPNPALAPVGMAGMNVGNSNVEIQVFYALGDLTGDSVSQFLLVATAGDTAFIDPGINAAGLYYGNPAPTGAVGGPGGYFPGFNPGFKQVINGWSSGPVTFLLEAWDSTGGKTYADSLLTGNSGLWVQNDIVLDDSVVSSAPPTPAVADNPAIMMSTVPEPTTLAFGGMGLLSLLAFARRKKV